MEPYYCTVLFVCFYKFSKFPFNILVCSVTFIMNKLKKKHYIAHCFDATQIKSSTLYELTLSYQRRHFVFLLANVTIVATAGMSPLIEHCLQAACKWLTLMFNTELCGLECVWPLRHNYRQDNSLTHKHTHSEGRPGHKHKQLFPYDSAVRVVSVELPALEVF